MSHSFEPAAAAPPSIVEVALGAALILARKWRTAIGWIVAGFFVAVLPGNVSQLVTHDDSFGLDTDLKRALRLPFQPVAHPVGAVVHGRMASMAVPRERGGLNHAPSTPRPGSRIRRPAPRSLPR